MIKGIRHTGLVVSDLDLSLKFWCELLDFKVMRRMDESGFQLDAMMGLNCVNVTTVKLSANNGSMIELLKFNSHPDSKSWNGTPYSTGLTHVALTVDDLECCIKRLGENGYCSINVPQISPDGIVKVVYMRGPEGILIELVEELGNEHVN